MALPSPAGTTTGVVLFSLGIFFFALNDALGKWLVTDYGVGQLLFMRTVGATFLLLPLLLRHRAGVALRSQWVWHGARVLFMAIDTYAFYFATRSLPLADVMTFYLASPILITALSVPFLGEKVGRFRWAAVGIGFVGVLIALRPTGAAFSVSALIALAGATMFASAITITRKLRDTHWIGLITWQFMGAGLVGGTGAIFDWRPPGLLDVGLMFLVGIVSILCFICLTKALSLAPASTLAPFQYLSIVWAVLLGWSIFGDAPTANILVGSAVIIASGLAVFLRERQLGLSLANPIEPVP